MTPLLVAATVASFNLVCTGLETSGVAEPPSIMKGLTSAQFTEVYRVNLDSGRWCRDDCASTKPIVKVMPRAIQFQEEENPGGSEYAFAKREDGFFRYILKIGSWMSFKEGKCVRADFTGFPTLKF